MQNGHLRAEKHTSCINAAASQSIYVPLTAAESPAEITLAQSVSFVTH